jgi:hypothetical protein
LESTYSKLDANWRTELERHAPQLRLQVTADEGLENGLRKEKNRRNIIGAVVMVLAAVAKLI